MNKQQVITLTYESAKNLKDLDKLEMMEDLDILDLELEFLECELKDLSRIFKSEQHMKIHHGIKADPLYNDLITHRSEVSEEDLNGSFDLSNKDKGSMSVIGENGNFSNINLATSVFFKESNHSIRNISRERDPRRNSASVMLNEEPIIIRRKAYSRFKRKISEDTSQVFDSVVEKKSSITTSMRFASLKQGFSIGVNEMSNINGLKQVLYMNLDYYKKVGKVMQMNQICR